MKPICHNCGHENLGILGAESGFTIIYCKAYETGNIDCRWALAFKSEEVIEILMGHDYNSVYVKELQKPR